MNLFKNIYECKADIDLNSVIIYKMLAFKIIKVLRLLLKRYSKYSKYHYH